MPWVAAGMLAASAVSSIAAGNAAASGAKSQAQAAARARAAFQNVQVPTIEEQKLILQNPDLMGQYTPEQLQAMQDMTTSMEGVKADQGLVDSQKEALAGISEVAKGGYSEADKSTAREIQRTVSQDAAARQKAILNSMAQRGVLGSGMELSAQLQGGQQAAEQMSRGGEGLTQQAQARALQALGQQGSLAGSMRSQDVGEQADVARARDAINQFNQSNRQNISNTNVGNQNQAQLLNLQQKQDMENKRAALANQQQTFNKGLLQTKYGNEMQKASGIAGAETNIGNAAANQANAQAAMIQGIGSGLTNAIGAYGSKK